MSKVILRSYKYGDEPEIKRLIGEAYMTPVWPLFVATLRREIFSQLILMIAAFAFVVVGIPLIQR